MIIRFSYYETCFNGSLQLQPISQGELCYNVVRQRQYRDGWPRLASPDWKFTKLYQMVTLRHCQTTVHLNYLSIISSYRNISRLRKGQWVRWGVSYSIISTNSISRRLFRSHPVIVVICLWADITVILWHKSSEHNCWKTSLAEVLLCSSLDTQWTILYNKTQGERATMVEPEGDVGGRSRSVSRCESRSQSRRSSVMSDWSEEDLDCSWRVWRSSRRRWEMSSSGLKYFPLLSSARDGSPVWWASPERTTESRVWGTCPGPSPGWARSSRTSVRARWWGGAGLGSPATPAGETGLDLTWLDCVLPPGQPRQGPAEDVGGPRHQAQSPVQASHHVCRLHQDTGGSLSRNIRNTTSPRIKVLFDLKTIFNSNLMFSAGGL